MRLLVAALAFLPMTAKAQSLFDLPGLRIDPGVQSIRLPWNGLDDGPGLGDFGRPPVQRPPGVGTVPPWMTGPDGTLRLGSPEELCDVYPAYPECPQDDDMPDGALP